MFCVCNLSTSVIATLTVLHLLLEQLICELTFAIILTIN